jgi:hypothetical protein
MFDIMFELPEVERGSKFIITEELARGDESLLPNGDSAAA